MTASSVNRIEDLYSERSNRAGVGTQSSTRSAGSLVAYLSGGFPDPRSLPKSDIIEATRIALEQDGEWALQYGASAGDPVLVEQLLAKLKRDQGIEAGPENLLITNGASQALNLVINMLVDPGDVVLSEAPTWTGAVRAFKHAGAEIREIGINDQGLDVTHLEAELNELQRTGRQPKLLYMIPNFQNPTGVTTTLDRRQRIVELAEQHNLVIVEDDAYSDLRFAGEKLPTLYTLDGGNRVIYMGTFSKIVAAGIRLGWAVANPEFINRMIALKAEGGTSPFASHVVASFASSGTLAEHVQELRGIYRTRRDALIAALEESMPAGTTWTEPEGGFFIWVTLPEGVDAGELGTAAAAKGVAISPGPGFFYAGRGTNNVRLSYSFNDPDQIREGIKILGDLVKEQVS